MKATKLEATKKLAELENKAARLKIAADAPREDFVEFMTAKLAQLLSYEAADDRVAVHGNYYQDAINAVENKMRNYANFKGIDYEAI